MKRREAAAEVLGRNQQRVIRRAIRISQKKATKSITVRRLTMKKVTVQTIPIQYVDLFTCLVQCSVTYVLLLCLIAENVSGEKKNDSDSSSLPSLEEEHRNGKEDGRDEKKKKKRLKTDQSTRVPKVSLLVTN